eukprot:PITA_05454
MENTPSESRWSVIAGLLPGRKDNEINNYWNTRLSKKLSVNQSEDKTRQNLEPRSKSPSILQDHVFKTIPIGITTTVKHSVMVSPEGRSELGCSNVNSRTKDQRSPDCKHFAGDAHVVDESLSDLKELLSPQWNLISSPSSLWKDFGLEAFCTGPATSLCPGTKEYEGMCSDDSIEFADVQGEEEVYDNIQHLDWIHELDYI